MDQHRADIRNHHRHCREIINLLFLNLADDGQGFTSGFGREDFGMGSTVEREEGVGEDAGDVEECPSEGGEDGSDPEEGGFVDEEEGTGVDTTQDGKGDQQGLPVCY